MSMDQTIIIIKSRLQCIVQKNPKCKFLVWSPTEHIILDAPYIRDWKKEKISHLTKVYFEHVLPAMATSITHGVMKVCGQK